MYLPGLRSQHSSTCLTQDQTRPPRHPPLVGVYCRPTVLLLTLRPRTPQPPTSPREVWPASHCELTQDRSSPRVIVVLPRCMAMLYIQHICLCIALYVRVLCCLNCITRQKQRKCYKIWFTVLICPLQVLPQQDQRAPSTTSSMPFWPCQSCAACTCDACAPSWTSTPTASLQG